MTTTYLLSGGGTLGAFQAGVLAALQPAIDEGQLERPEHIVGISVGGLNATLAALNHHDWRWVANHWHQNVRRPEDIAIRKSVPLRVLPGVLRGEYDGLVNTLPLRRMMHTSLSLAALRESPITPHAGAVNLNTGALVYRTPSDERFLAHLLASASIPAIFPTVEIDGEPWADGGLVEVAPATHCIGLGADRIIAILCQPEDQKREPIDAGDPWALAERLMDIVTTSLLEKDVRAIESVNRRIRRALTGVHPSEKAEVMGSHGLTGKRHVQVTIIRPPVPLGYNTGAFTERDIARALDMGRAAGAAFVQTLANRGWARRAVNRQPPYDLDTPRGGVAAIGRSVQGEPRQRAD